MQIHFALFKSEVIQGKFVKDENNYKTKQRIYVKLRRVCF